MTGKFVSLLYPTEEIQIHHQDRNNLPTIDESVCDELGLNEIFMLKSSSLTDFFTSDPEVIEYRQRTIRDLLANPELLETLSTIHPILDDIRELRRLDSENSTAADSYRYSITEIELYVTCLDTLRRGFADVKDRLDSPAFRTLTDFISELTESEYYVNLNKKLVHISFKCFPRSFNGVKSIFDFIKRLAEYEKMTADVVASEALRMSEPKP